MRVRGRRECQDCGTRWSYYDTGSVECPNCGGLRSVGLDEERTLHTDSPVTLDLTPVRNALEADESLRRVAEQAAEACREYTRARGFVDGGDLQPLDDTFLAAMELQYVAGEVARGMRVDDDEEYHLLDLLRGADYGERPPAAQVPDSLRSARGLAYADAVDAYRSDVRDYLDEHPDDLVGDVLDPLGDHVRRVHALDGDVSPDRAGRLVTVARAIGRYLAGDDEGALLEAENGLERLRG